MGQAIPQIIVIDDDASVRTALRRLLQASGYRVRTAKGPREVLSSGRPDGPSCLLLDLRLEGTSGLDVQQALADTQADLPIVFLSGRADVRSSVRAMKAGAIDFLTKPVQEAELLAAVDRAVRLDETLTVRRRDRESMHARYRTLTPREQEVMAAVTSGKLNKQTAFALGIAEKTVKVHRARVMQKMGVVSLADLVRCAEALGLASGETDVADPIAQPGFVAH